VVIVVVGLVNGGVKGGGDIVCGRIREMGYTAAVGDVAMRYVVMRYVVVGVSIVGSVLWASAWVEEMLNMAEERWSVVQLCVGCALEGV
jgi:hypothetical protein